MIYFITIILASLYYLLFNNVISDYKRERNMKIYFVFMFFAIFIISALRSPVVGHDTYTYIGHFERIINMSFGEVLSNYSSEPGLYVICKILSIFTYNGQWLLVVIASIYSFAICRFIKSYSLEPTTSYLVLLAFQFLAFSIAGLRQTLALSIILIFFHYIVDRKLYRFLIVIFIASLFHKSAILALPIYFLFSINMTNKKRILFIASIPIVYLLRNPILGLFLTYFYTDYQIYEKVAGTMLTFLLYFIIWTAYLFFAKNHKFDGFEAMFMLGILGQLFVPLEPNIYRVCMYFQISSLVILPTILKAKWKLRDKILLHITCYSVLTYMYFKFTYYAAGMNPYYFFWEF